MWLEDLADRQEAAGKNGSSFRGLIRRQSMLTVADEAAVKRIARDYRERSESILTAARAKAKAGQLEEASLTAKGREQLALRYVEQLRSILGESTFRKLDLYVRLNVKIQPPRFQSSPSAGGSK